MKAAVIEHPGRLIVREVPDPEIGDYDALCVLLYGATCSGTDQHLIGGHFPWPVPYPTILGHESIGRVIRVGPRVRNLTIGDLVTRVGALASPGVNINWGGFAEYGVARDHWACCADGRPEAEWKGFRVNQILPPEIDPRVATMFTTWRETLSYLIRMGVGADARVLVIGSGGVGLSFVAQAANLGARVVLSGSLGRKVQGRAAGAECCYHYRDPELVSRLRAATPEGYDFIVDAVGKEGQMDAVLPLLKAGGTAGIYGIDDYGQCTVDPLRSRGTFTFYNGGYDEAETHGQVTELWRQGRLRADIWLELEHAFELDDIGQAIDAIKARTMVKSLVRLKAAS